MDRASDVGFSLVDRPEGGVAAGPGVAVVDVRQVSLVGRDLRYAPQMVGEGGVWGFDAGGVVAEAATDATGPPAGTPVALCLPRPGAWVERLAVPVAELAIVPAGVELATAAALAIPGVSARQALARLGPLAGRRLLVTGAAGAVGRLATQLAAQAGAHVVAAVRSTAGAESVAELGAAEVVTDVHDIAPVDHAIEVVGGPTLVRAFALVAEGGSVQSVGAVADEDAVFGPRAFLGPRRSLEAFWGTWPMGPDLQALLDLVADGRLRPPAVTHGGPWHDHAATLAALADGRIRGKAALAVG